MVIHSSPKVHMFKAISLAEVNHCFLQGMPGVLCLIDYLNYIIYTQKLTQTKQLYFNESFLTAAVY